METFVVGVDASDAAAGALRWAATEARRAGARLLVVHAYRAPLAYVGDEEVIAHIDPELHAKVQGHLRAFVGRSGADLDGLEVEQRLHAGRPIDGLLAACDDADLLVVGARGGGGFEGMRLGSTAGHCVRRSPVPVVVVRSPSPTAHRRVVVGVDGSAAALEAVRWSVPAAQARGATLELVGAYEPHDGRVPFGGEFPWHVPSGSRQQQRQRADDHLEEAAVKVLDLADVTWHTTVAEGHPAQILIEQSFDAQLVAVGAGRGHLPGGHLGAVARQLLHHAGCPVAVVREPATADGRPSAA